VKQWNLDDCIESDYCQIQSHYNKLDEDMQCEASHWFRNFVRKDYFPDRTLHTFILRKHFSLKQAKLISSYMNFVYVKLPFSGAFLKLRKATICFNISLSVSPRWTTWIPLNEFAYIWGYFENLSRQFKLHYNLTRTTGTLHEDLCTFVVTPRWILPRLRNVSDKRRRKNQKTHFMFNDFFNPKIMPVTR
jgi:hypothetical protein